MIRAFALATLCFVVAAEQANAEDHEFLAPFDDSGTFTFVWENDYFANTDRNYTNGLRFSYLSGFKQPNGVTRWVADNI
ncbi:MAG: lipid A-modifier LpxR family protein, partial [Pseudomonadota bacterium]